jgi:hypothetical protein
MPVKLNDSAVKNLPTPAKGQPIYYDSQLSGLAPRRSYQ